MKKVLMILYQFPPCNDVGAFRSVKFIKYLSDFNWHPVVLAPLNAEYASYDFEKEDSIRHLCTIYRCPLLNPFGLIHGIGSKNTGGLYQLIWRIWNRAAIPDGAILWFVSAFARSLAIIRKEKINIIFVSGQPFSVFVIAAMVKKITGLPLVLDYRDPWTMNPFHKGLPGAISLERKMEQKILRLADAAVFTTRAAADLHISAFSDYIDMHQIHTITNSYEPVRNKYLSRNSGHKFLIVHAGNLYGNRDPKSLFKGIALAAGKNSVFERSVQVEFYGIVDYSKYRKSLERLGIHHLIKFRGRIPYDRLMRKLQKADVQILINSHGKGHEIFIPAKFFDYLKIGRPVLCLTRNGALKDIMKATKAGHCVDPEDAEKICSLLLKMFNAGGAANANDNKKTRKIREQYESLNTTRKLTRIFDRVISQ